MRTALLGAALASLMGCASEVVPEEPDEDGLSGMLPVNVSNQVLSNCWAYTSTAWVESLHVRAGGQPFNFSESYMTYWLLFQRLNNVLTAPITKEKQSALGFTEAKALLSERGLMMQSEFLEGADGTAGQRSELQAAAVERLSTWIRSGGIRRAPLLPGARRRYMRAALDKAWGLSDKTRSRLGAVFGEDYSRTIDEAPANTFGTQRIMRPADLSVAIFNPDGDAPTVGTLADLVGGGALVLNSSKYPHAMRDSYLTPLATARSERAFRRQVQRLLQQGIPVWIGWWVDEGARADGRFSGEVLAKEGTHGVFAHASLLLDYQARLSSGELVPAGEKVTDAAVAKKLLAEDVRFEFWRIQNSWGLQSSGGVRPDGTNDILESYWAYPVKKVAGITTPSWMAAAFPVDMPE